MNASFAASLETPGMRYGADAPTTPALRAPFRCSLSAGSRPNSLRSNKGEPLSAESCAPQRRRGGAHPAPHTGLERRRNDPERVDGVGAPAPGGPLRRRRAAERQADQGSQLFERSEFCETPRNASTAGEPRSGRHSGADRAAPRTGRPINSSQGTHATASEGS